MSQITLLLEQAHAGDDAAWQQVVALLYGDLLRLARCASTSGRPNTLNATALVHECYLRIASNSGENGIGSRYADILIGKPIFNTQAYVLDETIEVVPMEVATGRCQVATGPRTKAEKPQP
jgi:non-ribosomal peptide synthetase component F